MEISLCSAARDHRKDLRGDQRGGQVMDGQKNTPHHPPSADKLFHIVDDIEGQTHTHTQRETASK